MAPIVFAGILELAKKLIPDKDKYKELETQVKQAEIEFDRLLLGTTTTPKVDAFVKILYAVERFISTLWRPLGSAAMTAFGLYAHYKGMSIDTMTHSMLDGAFAAWGVSRHMNKTEELKNKKGAGKRLPDIELQ